MNVITPATVLRRRSDVRYRRIEGEAVVLRQAAPEVLVLNEVARRAARAADGERRCRPRGPMPSPLDTTWSAPFSRATRSLSRGARRGGPAGGRGVTSLSRGDRPRLAGEPAVLGAVELTYRCNLDCFFCYNDLACAARPSPRGVLPAARRAAGDAGDEPDPHRRRAARPPRLLGDRRRRRASCGFVVRVKSNGHASRASSPAACGTRSTPTSSRSACTAPRRRPTTARRAFRAASCASSRTSRGLRAARPAGEAQRHPHGLERGRDPGDVRARRRPRHPAAVRSRGDAARRRRPLAADAHGRRGKASATCSAWSSSAARPRRPPPRRGPSRWGARRDDAPAGLDRQALRRGLVVDRDRPLRQRLPLRAVARAVGEPPRATIQEIWRAPRRSRRCACRPRKSRSVVGAEGPAAICSTSAPARPPPGRHPLELYPAAVQRRELLEQVMSEEESGRKRTLLPIVR